MEKLDRSLRLKSILRRALAARLNAIYSLKSSFQPPD